MPRRAEGPRDASAYRETARYHVVQKDRAMLYGAETARSCGVQRDHATPRRAEGPRDATLCRETARSYGVQKDRATLRGVETARRCSVQRKIVQIKVILRPRRRPIDHGAFWTGVVANRTRPARPAAHSTPANRLRIR